MSIEGFVPAETRQQARAMVRAAAQQHENRQRVMEAERDREAAREAIHPLDWIEEHFRIPETPDKKLRLEPYQRYVLRRVLTRTPDGDWPYATVLWSDIKKSIKSTIAAAVVLYVATHVEWGSIYIVANDLKQADSRVGYYLRRAIELNRKKFGNVRIRGRTTVFPNGTFVEAIPIDPSGEAGSNADLIVWSETWGSHQKAHVQMWTEMTLSPTKYGRNMRWVETYAGHVGESDLLEQLWSEGLERGEAIDGAPDEHHWGADPLPLFENATARMLTMWNETPRLPWQTPAYYAEEAAMLPPNEFERIHRNQWVSSEDEFVPIEWWDACGDLTGDPLEDLPPRAQMVLAADASVTGDTTALVGVRRHPDHDDHVIVSIARRWEPSVAKPMDYEKTLIPSIVAAIDTWNVLQVAYDAYQLHQPMTNLRRQNSVWVKSFKQGGDREIADKQLRDLIRERRIHWYPGSQGALREHIQNANAKTAGADDERLRIVKRSPQRKVDLAVALSMGCREVLRLNTIAG